MQRFAERFGANAERWQFLTGDKPEIVRLAVDEMKLIAREKPPGEQVTPEDLFIHATIFVAIDRQGRLRGVLESMEDGWKEKAISIANSLLNEHSKMTIQDLPLINACLNGLATVFLTLGFVFIKKGNKTAHRNCMISAFVTSAVFLTCYLIYHYNTGSTKFVEPAWFKPIYFTILITHIILAVVILPLIFMTLQPRVEGAVSSSTKKSPSGRGLSGCTSQSLAS